MVPPAPRQVATHALQGSTPSPGVPSGLLRGATTSSSACTAPQPTPGRQLGVHIARAGHAESAGGGGSPADSALGVDVTKDNFEAVFPEVVEALQVRLRTSRAAHTRMHG